MRMLPTRAWVREHLAAYICRETTPFASLWIRLYILMCPECRGEYQSLKEVWRELDCWEVDPPADDLEDRFSRTLRGKFPMAFEAEGAAPLPRSGDMMLRFAYTTAILILAAGVFFLKETNPQSSLQHIALAPETKDLKKPQSPATESQLAKTNLDAAQEEASPLRFEDASAGARPRTTVVGLDDRQPAPRGVPVYTTSTQPSPRQLPGGSRLQRLTKTVEINNQPVTVYDLALAGNNGGSY
ncbi:MAG: hypothetical protein HUU16_00340 [Candidatus Omnitrophica bacterium]|nr:hypothetical protein [Candidatus Omnitrophota bacterium]